MTRRTHVICFIASTLAMVSLSNEGRSQTGEGAVLGGVAGAVIGGIIGHQNHETPEGALIGGAVGAVAGGVFGKQKEQQNQIRYYEQQQAYQQGYQMRQAAPVYTTHVHSGPVYTSTVRTTPVRRPVCVSDVIRLVRSGVSEAVIINHIQSNGVISQPNIDDVLTMHDAGVCDYIIDAMQKAPVGGTVVVSQVPVQSAPVIIHEEYQSTPVYVTRPTYQSGPTYYQPAHSHPTYLQAAPLHRRNF